MGKADHQAERGAGNVNEKDKIIAIDAILKLHKEEQFKLAENKLIRLNTVINAIAELPGSIERGIYIGETSLTFNVPRDDVENEVKVKRNKLLSDASPNRDLRNLADELKKQKKKEGDSR